MPGTYCAIGTCKNNRNTRRKLMFHRFPKNEEILQMWIKNCNRVGKWNTKNSFLCSEHFTEDDYVRDLKNEMLNLPLRKRLKPRAIPHLKITATTDNQSQINNQGIGKNNETSKIVHNNLDTTSHKSETVECPSPISSNKCDEADSISLDEECHNENYEHLKTECVNIQNDNDSIKKQLQDKDGEIAQYLSKIKSLEKEIAEVKTDLSNEKSTKSKIEENLRTFLSQPQLDIIFGNKANVEWTHKDISNAFSIMLFSKDCYKFLREKLKFPLPGISSLQRWATELNINTHEISI